MSIQKENIKINKKINGIAYYQIFGGVTGAILMFIMVIGGYSVLGSSALVLIVPVLFFSFSVIAGIYLLKRKKNYGLLTKINQLMQIPQISIYGFSFQYFAGLFFGVGLSGIFNFNLNLSLPDFKFVLTGSSDEFILMINLIPIILLNRLKKYESQIESNNNALEIVKSHNKKTNG